MEFFTDAVMRDLLASSLDTAALGPEGFHGIGTSPGSTEAAYDRLAHRQRQRAECRADVTRIRQHRGWCLGGSRSTATSTTSRPAAWSRSPDADRSRHGAVQLL